LDANPSAGLSKLHSFCGEENFEGQFNFSETVSSFEGKNVESGAKSSHFSGGKKTMIFQEAFYVSRGNLINTGFFPRKRNLQLISDLEHNFSNF